MYCSIKFTFGHYFAYLSNFFTSFFALSVHRNVFVFFSFLMMSLVERLVTFAVEEFAVAARQEVCNRLRASSLSEV